MARILTIDRGNTSVKVAVFHGGKLSASASGRSVVDAVGSLPEGALAGLHGAILCSVADVSAEELRHAQSLCTRFIELDADTPLPLKIDYTSASTLGADRIAAAVGAATLYPGRDVLVVDAGTAVTYDYVSADGTFRGGNIAPGIGMRLDSLHHFTARLPRPELPEQVDTRHPMGSSTRDALIKGAVLGVAAEIAYYAKRLKNSLVLLTGGDSSLLSKATDIPTIVEPNLVTIGLNRILSYNETK